MIKAFQFAIAHLIYLFYGFATVHNFYMYSIHSDLCVHCSVLARPLVSSITTHLTPFTPHTPTPLPFW